MILIANHDLEMTIKFTSIRSKLKGQNKKRKQKNDMMLTNDKDQMCNIEKVLLKSENLKEGNADMLKHETASVDHF